MEWWKSKEIIDQHNQLNIIWNLNKKNCLFNQDYITPNHALLIHMLHNLDLTQTLHCRPIHRPNDKRSTVLKAVKNEQILHEPCYIKSSSFTLASDDQCVFCKKIFIYIISSGINNV